MNRRQKVKTQTFLNHIPTETIIDKVLRATSMNHFDDLNGWPCDAKDNNDSGLSHSKMLNEEVVRGFQL